MRKTILAVSLIVVACGAWILLRSSSGWIPDAPGEAGVAQAATTAPAQATTGLQERPRLDVPYVPTPQEIVNRMLELAEIKEGDLLYDLGCGDGRIVVTAAREYGVKAIGIDIDPERIEEAKENVEEAGVGDLVTIKQGSIFEEDFSDADVVTMYLLPNVNEKLKPQLAKLKPGSRIVSHSFSMRGAKPEQVVEVETSDGIIRDLYVWTVPWEEED